MAKSNFRTWVTGEMVTAAMLNEQIRDNGNEIWKGTTAGDIDFYISATEKARLGIGSSNQLLTVSSGSPIWKDIHPLYRRQGGHATEWSVDGSTNYTPSTSIIQAGVAKITISGSTEGTETITYPVAYSDRPIVIASHSIGASGIHLYDFGTSGQTATQFSVTAKFSTTVTTTIIVQWMAIGY